MPTPSEIAGRRADVAKAEGMGIVTDSMEVRKALMQQFHDGEKALDEVQTELKRIKRDGTKAGKITRDQAYRGRY